MEKLNILWNSTDPPVMNDFRHLEGLLDKILIVAKN
jgi:hypothetical protein